MVSDQIKRIKYKNTILRKLENTVYNIQMFKLFFNIIDICLKIWVLLKLKIFD